MQQEQQQLEQAQQQGTLFYQKSKQYQHSQDRTKAEGMKTALGVLGVSILAAVGATILQLVLGETCGVVWCILPIVAVLGALGTIVGFIWTIVNSVRPTKVIACPRCGTGHRVYRSVTKYMCTSCRTLLLVHRDLAVNPEFSACPYCGLQTAVSEGHGAFLCPNCGLVREAGGLGGAMLNQACPACSKPVPQGVIYCKHCGGILASDFDQPAQGNPLLAYDQDWRIGKDPAGHFYFTKALLLNIRQRAARASDVEQMQALITKMEDALVSMEEAHQQPELRPHVLAVVPEVDMTYAHLLECELRVIQALKPKKRLKKGALDTLAADAHVTARRRIEEILGPGIQSGGGIGKWEEKIVDVEQGDSHSRVRDYAKLTVEVNRFRQWAAGVGQP